MNEIFQGGQNAPQRIDNRSLVTNDITGASAKRHYIPDPSIIAGVRTGSPTRKNESSVFSHLNDTYDRDAFKRKDLSDISKPRVVTNNLSSQQKLVSFNEKPTTYDYPPMMQEQPQYQSQNGYSAQEAQQ